MLYEIKDLHLELSSFCNARCPLCPRNVWGKPYNAGYTETNLTKEQFAQIFQPKTLEKIDSTLINGNFGDFVMNPDSVDIIKYLKASNPHMRIRVSTNGSARDADFWQDLGRMGITIEFCIDGLEDTHNLYRQDTSFSRILRNAKDFIAHGGQAIWRITEFEHNRLQIEAMRDLAQQIGFKETSVRARGRDTGPVYDREGKKIFIIGTSPDTWPEMLDEKFLDDYYMKMATAPSKVSASTEITCQALNERSIYLSADGHVYPCCWTGFNPKSYKGSPSFGTFGKWNKQLLPYVSHNNALEVGLDQALEWFHHLSDSWKSPDQPEVCKFFCGAEYDHSH